MMAIDIDEPTTTRETALEWAESLPEVKALIDAVRAEQHWLDLEYRLFIGESGITKHDVDRAGMNAKRMIKAALVPFTTAPDDLH